MKKTLKSLAMIAISIMLCCFLTAVAVMTPSDEDDTVRTDAGFCNESEMIKWTLDDAGTSGGHLCDNLVLEPANNTTFYEDNHSEYRATADYVIYQGSSTSPWTLFSDASAENRWVTTLTVSSGIEQIGTYAFAGQIYLTTVNLYPTLTGIGANAFSGCTAISRINFYGTKAQWEAISIGSGNAVLNNSYESLVSSGILVDNCGRNGHTYNDGVWSYNEEGHYHICTVCGAASDAMAHSYVYNRTATAAGCTTAGTDVYACSVCGREKNVSTAALGHSYNSVVTAPTCTAQGYTTHTCSRCGDSYVDAYTDALGHSYGEWSVYEWPTLTENGTAVHTCSICGHSEYGVITFVAGDVNGDGVINKTDVQLISEYALGLIDGEGLKLEAVDVNDDGEIDVLDTVKIMLYINGGIDKIADLVIAG